MFRKRKFHIPIHGRFPSDRIVIDDSDERMMMTPKLKELIEEVWVEREKRAARVDASIVPGDLCRLIHYWLEGNVLRLCLGRTTFKELLGTNLSHPIIHRILGQEYMASGLGVRAVIRTADEKIIIGQRSEKVMEAAGYYHLCGGYIDPRKHMVDNHPDPYVAMQSHMNDELGIPSSAVRHLVCLGVVIDSQTLKPELMFEAEIDLTFRKVLLSMRTAARAAVHSELFGIMAVRASLRGFLAATRGKIAPTGQGCLLVYGVERGYWAEVKKGILKKYVEKKRLKRTAKANKAEPISELEA